MKKFYQSNFTRWKQCCIVLYPILYATEYRLLSTTYSKRVLMSRQKSLCFLHSRKFCIKSKNSNQQTRFFWNREHSCCWFASLKWFRIVHVHHAFLINDFKTLLSLVNLKVQFYLLALLNDAYVNKRYTNRVSFKGNFQF